MKKIYLILLLALCLRLPLLNGSFWLDEAAQYLESARPLHQQLQIRDDFQPPLMHLLTFVAIRLGSLFNLETSEWFIRIIPSLIPGLLTIWGTYVVARTRYSKKTAVLASFLLSLSSLHIFYSQELRPYSLPAAWALFSTWYMLKQKWRGFVVSSILGLYSSYLYPFLLIGQGAYLIYKKIPYKKLIGLVALITLAYIPWLPKFFEQLQAGQELRLSMPGWDQVVSLPQFKTALLVPLKFIFGVLDLSAHPLYVLTTAIIFITMTYLFYQGFLKPKRTRELDLVFYCLLLPLLLSWLVSFFVPVLQAKRVLILLPFWNIMLAELITRGKHISSYGSKILLFAIISVSMWATVSYWTQSKLQRENWRSLTQEVASRFKPENTVMVFGFDHPFAPWRYYAKESFPTISSGTFYANNLKNPSEQLKGVQEYTFVLLFDYLRDLTDPDDILGTTIVNLGFREVGVLDYPQIGFVRIYSKALLAYEYWD